MALIQLIKNQNFHPGYNFQKNNKSAKNKRPMLKEIKSQKIHKMKLKKIKRHPKHKHHKKQKNLVFGLICSFNLNKQQLIPKKIMLKSQHLRV